MGVLGGVPKGISLRRSNVAAIYVSAKLDFDHRTAKSKDGTLWDAYCSVRRERPSAIWPRAIIAA